MKLNQKFYLFLINTQLTNIFVILSQNNIRKINFFKNLIKLKVLNNLQKIKIELFINFIFIN